MLELVDSNYSPSKDVVALKGGLCVRRGSIFFYAEKFRHLLETNPLLLEKLFNIAIEEKNIRLTDYERHVSGEMNILSFIIGENDYRLVPDAEAMLLACYIPISGGIINPVINSRSSAFKEFEFGINPPSTEYAE